MNDLLSIQIKILYQHTQHVQPVVHRFYQEVVHMAVTVTLTTHDGKVYTDTSKIEIPRNEHTEMFYQMLENYVPKTDKI